MKRVTYSRKKPAGEQPDPPVPVPLSPPKKKAGLLGFFTRTNSSSNNNSLPIAPPNHSKVPNTRKKQYSDDDDEDDDVPRSSPQFEQSYLDEVLEKCNVCQMRYSKGVAGDEALHKRHCKRFLEGVKWPSNEGEVLRSFPDGTSIVFTERISSAVRDGLEGLVEFV
jgi:hypothetical protein